MIKSSETTGRVHEYESFEKFIEGEKEIETEVIEMLQKVSCDAQGGMMSLPTVPIDVNVRSEHLDAASKGVGGIFDTIKEKFASLSQWLNWDDPDIFNMDMAIVILVIANYHYKTKILGMMLGVVIGVRMMAALMTGSPEFMDYLEAYNHQKSTVEKMEKSTATEPIQMRSVSSQGVDTLNPIVTNLLLTSLHGVTGFAPREPFIKAMLEMTKVTETQRGNVMGLLTAICRNISSFFTQFEGTKNLGLYFDIDSYKYPETEIFITKVERFLNSISSDNPQADEVNEQCYTDYSLEGRGLLARLERSSFDYRAVDHALIALSRYRSDKVQSSFSLAGTRQEPVAFLFRGPPGVAKTVASNSMVDVLLEQLVPEHLAQEAKSNPSKFKYAKGLDKFFDTYSPSTVVTVMDDFGSARDTASSTATDAQLIIDMVNCNPMPLQMAKAEDKNKVFFRSLVLAATTNLQDFARLESVTDYKAVERRFHFQVDVKIANDYCDQNGKMDQEKLPFYLDEKGEIPPSTYIPEDFWIFDVYQMKGNRKEHLGLQTFEDLAVLILDEVRVHRNQYLTNMAVNKMRKEKLKRRVDKNKPAELDRPATPQSGIEEHNFLKQLKGKGKVPLNIGRHQIPRGASPDYSEYSGPWIYPTPPGVAYNDAEFISIEPDCSVHKFQEFFANSLDSLPLLDQKRFMDDFLAWCAQKDSLYHRTALDYGIKGIARMLHRNQRTDVQFYRLHFSKVLSHIQILMTAEYSDGANYAMGRLKSSKAETIMKSIKGLIVRFSRWIYDNHVVISLFLLGSFLVYKLFVKVVNYFYPTYNFEDPSELENFDQPVFSENIMKYKTRKGEVVNIHTHFKDKVIRYEDEKTGKVHMLSANPILMGGEWVYEELSTGNLMSSLDTNLHSTGMFDRNSQEVVDFLKISKVNIQPHGYCSGEGVISRLPKLNNIDFGERGSENDVLAKVFNSYYFSLFVVFKREDDPQQFPGGFELLRIGMSTNVRSNIFMCNAHFIEQITALMNARPYRGGEVILSTCTRSIIYRFPLEQLYWNLRFTDDLVGRDLCFFTVKQAQYQSTGMMRYFLKRKDFDSFGRYGKIRARITGSKINNPFDPIMFIKQQAVTVNKYNSPLEVDDNWTGKKKPYYVMETVMYHGTSFGPGDCGSLISLINPVEGNRMFFGVHAAGGDGNGFATVITQEEIESALLEVDMFKKDVYTDEVIPDIGIPYGVEAQGCMKPISDVYPELLPTSTTYSALTKSALYNKLPDSFPRSGKTPARLKKFIYNELEIDPAKEALKNYTNQPPMLTDDILQDAVNSYEELITDHMDIPDDLRRLLTIEEAIKGYGNLKAIDPSTSAGWPHNVTGEENLKKMFNEAVATGDEQKILEALNRVEEECDAMYQLIRAGIRPFLPFILNLKDEKLSIAKALSGRSRLFGGACYELLILFRRYFGAFMSAYYDANINVGSAIGLNPFSQDWDNIARMLRTTQTEDFKENIGAGDYKAFDGHLHAGVLQAILGIINRWYGKPEDHEDSIVRSRLWAEVTNARCIFKGEIYEWFMSMMSGNPMTAIINTMYNNIELRMAWVVCELPIQAFNKNVKVIALGDDHVWSVTKMYTKYFNEILMPEVMEKLGMVYTTELKEAATRSYRTLEEVEFLKRKFKFDIRANRHIAPLREESILEAVYWTKKGNLKNQITADNVANALREYALWGKEKFDKFRNEVVPLVRRYLPDVKPNTPFVMDYDYALSEVLSGNYKYDF